MASQYRLPSAIDHSRRQLGKWQLRKSGLVGDRHATLGVMTVERPYPHSRDDCDSCRSFDADMRATYPELGPGKDVLWCQRCAGQILTKLVQDGISVTVYSPDGREPPAWTVELAEEVLRGAKPIGSQLLRAVIDEGGTASVERLREVLGVQELQRATLTLNQAARRTVDGAQRWTMLIKGRFLVAPRKGTRGKVYGYTMAKDVIPTFDQALRRLAWQPDSSADIPRTATTCKALQKK